jgi:hypothetical protein
MIQRMFDILAAMKLASEGLVIRGSGKFLGDNWYHMRGSYWVRVGLNDHGTIRFGPMR